MNFLGPGPLAAPTPEVGSVGPEAARKDLPPASGGHILCLGHLLDLDKEEGIHRIRGRRLPLRSNLDILARPRRRAKSAPGGGVASSGVASSATLGHVVDGIPTPRRHHRPMPDHAVSHPGHPGLRPRVHETPQDAKPAWHHAARKQSHGVSCTAPVVRNEPVRVASTVKSDDRRPRAKAGTTRDRNGPGFSGLT